MILPLNHYAVTPHMLLPSASQRACSRQPNLLSPVHSEGYWKDLCLSKALDNMLMGEAIFSLSHLIAFIWFYRSFCLLSVNHGPLEQMGETFFLLTVDILYSYCCICSTISLDGLTVKR